MRRKSVVGYSGLFVPSVFWLLGLVALLSSPLSEQAEAACNLIPQTTQTFDAALGSVNRPFAAPGEPIEVRIRPCDGTSTAPTGFVDPADNYVVTVVFTPTDFEHNAVVVSTDCTFFHAGGDAVKSACDAQLNGGTSTCIPVTAGAGQDLEVVLRQNDQQMTEQRLSIHFPNTDDRVGMVGDQKTFAGPATIAVTKVGDALPCQLATAPCRAQTGLVACVDDFFASDGTCQTQVARSTFTHFTALPPANNYQADCFDEVVPCDPTQATDLRLTTDAAGNVLVPMDWRGILVRQNQVPVPRLLRATLDQPNVPITVPGKTFVSSWTPEGGPLPPIFEPEFEANAPAGVLTLFGSADAPYTVLRIARRSETFQQCTGGANTTKPCNEAADCPGACMNDATRRCTADTDCIASTCGPAGTCGPTVCNMDSTNAGAPCNTDANCPGGECGPELFHDVGALAFNGVGPLLIQRFGSNGICQQDTEQVCSLPMPCSSGPCAHYALEARNPVPLEGLVQTPDVFAFAVNEGVDGKDRNGDGDALDTVITLQDRATGATQPLGPPAPACGISPTPGPPPGPEGRAVVRSQQPPFSFPAIATENDVVAFLESEQATTTGGGPPNVLNPGCDENNDGDDRDTILRAFKLGPTSLVPDAGGFPRAVDGGLAIDGRSLALSNGDLFFRTPEAASAPASTVRAGTHSMNFFFDPPSISADGRYLVFSTADDLLPADTNGTFDIYVRDLATNALELVSITSGNVAGSDFSRTPYLSPNGRWVTFATRAPELAPNFPVQALVLRDRCVSNGVPVPSCMPSTVQVGLTASGGQPAGGTGPGRASVTDDGRFVAWGSDDSNIVPDDTNTCGFGPAGTCPDIFVRDRCVSNATPVPSCTPTTERVSIATDGTQGNAQADDFFAPDISSDGNIVVFNSLAGNLVSPPQRTGFGHIYVRNRRRGTTELASARPDGLAGIRDALGHSTSGDSRYVAFESQDSFLVPGIPANFLQEIFLRDRTTGTNELISRGPDGTAANDHSYAPSISHDGRYVAYVSCATNLVPGDTNTCTQTSACANNVAGSCPDVFVYDRATGITRRVNVAPDGSQTSGDMVCDGDNHFCGLTAIAADGQSVAFDSNATTLLGPGNDTNGFGDTFVRRVDPIQAGSHDLTGDGDANDVVLQTLDTTAMTPAVTTLCPTGLVSVANGMAAFLRPETAGPAPSLETPGTGVVGCPVGTSVAGGISLNGDGDTTDDVVHLWRGTGSVENLHCAATAVSLSATHLAALVDEAAQGDGSLNGDTDTTDTVVKVYALDTPTPGSCTEWTNVGQAADVVQATGSLVVFITPENAQGDDLNHDRDTNDRVLQVYDAVADRVTNTKQAAEEFVVGDTKASCADSPLVAFRTSEAAQGNTDLNNTGQNMGQGDGDTDDDVLQIYAQGLGVVNTHQAVTPCRLEACDPRFPYRVIGDTVKFLTLESQQGQDLNGNGNMTDLILQIYDACKKTFTVVGPVDPGSGQVGDPLDPPLSGGSVVVTDSGRCMTPLAQPPSCTTDAHCQDMMVMGTPGALCRASGCVLPLLVPPTCRLSQMNADCPTGATCESDQVAGTSAPPPAHDTVVTPLKPLTVTISNGTLSVSKTLKVKVGNADRGEIAGHAVGLAATDGTCPAGTVVGLPDFGDDAVAGAPATAMVPGGKTRQALVTLSVARAAFSTHNHLAPQRCRLRLEASTVLAGNVDPTPRNNVVEVELNVIDKNDPEQTTVHESVIGSLKPVKLSVGNSGTTSKTVKVKVTNADLGEANHAVMVTASDGDCPTGTVGTPSPNALTVSGGDHDTVTVPIVMASDNFKTSRKTSPGRCTALVTATTNVIGNVEPDPSNNSAQLVIDVVHK